MIWTIWNIKSAPALAALSNDEANLLIQEAFASRSVRWSSLFGLNLCGLCAATGSWIGDAFSTGIFGAGIGGGIGGFIFSQMRARAILRWVEAQNKAFPSGRGLPA